MGIQRLIVFRNYLGLISENSVRLSLLLPEGASSDRAASESAWMEDRTGCDILY